MNGANIGSFDLNSPADTESLGLTDDRIRSVKSTFQQALDDEHNFPSGGGASVGYHRLGSGRAYFGPQSTVSSSGTDGRFMVTSDTSRIFGVGSTGTVMLGAGPGSLSIGSGVVVPQRHYWVDEFGHGVTTSTGSAVVTIPNSGYSGMPFIWVSNQIANAVSIGAILSYATVDSQTFHVRAINTASSVISDVGFTWLSRGTRVL